MPNIIWSAVDDVCLGIVSTRRRDVSQRATEDVGGWLRVRGEHIAEQWRLRLGEQRRGEARQKESYVNFH